MNLKALFPSAKLSAENILQMIIDTTTDAVYVKGLDGRYLMINPATLKLLGKRAEEVIGNDDRELFPAAYLERVLASDRQAIETGTVIHYEAPLPRPDGSTLIMSVTKGPLRDDAGRIYGVFGISRDITAAKKSEEQLRASEQRFRALAIASSDVIYRMSPDWGEMRQLQGKAFLLDTDTPEHSWIDKYIPAAEQPLVLAAIRRAIATKSTYQLEHRVFQADGSVGWAFSRAVPVLDERGGILEWFGAASDVTTRRQAEETLRNFNVALERKLAEQTSEFKASEERFRTFMDNGPAIAWMKDEDGRHVYLNANFERRFMILPEAVLGKTDFEIWPPQIAAQNRRNDFAVLHSGETLEVTEEAVDARGERSYWWVAKFPLRDASGQRFVGGIAIDITQGKQHEVELVRARRDADAASRAKSEFLATMSHELRTPLNGIVGMAQLLALTDLNDEQQDCLEAIQTSSDSLLTLIDDILDLAKIEAGKVELISEEFSLRKVIEEVVTAQSALIVSKGLAMTREIPAEIPDQLTGDPLRLRQILLNLLGNAIKFTRQGEIRVAVTTIGSRRDQVRLAISVTDTGIGISAEQLKKLFQPFTQVDSSDSRQYKGTGLGLAICTRLAGMMGGTIEVESREGVGSTFTVELPFTLKPPAAAAVPVPAPGSPAATWAGPPLRILIADDDPTSLELLARILKTYGFTVAEAGSGREALERLAGEPFDLLLTDVQMAEMDGIEALKIIRDRERESGGHLPVIAVTGRALRQEQEHIRGQGFDGCITKPYKIAALLEAIRNCLGKDPAPA